MSKAGFRFTPGLSPENLMERLDKLPEGGLWRVDDVFDDLDVSFRLLGAVHDLRPGVSYATAADAERPFTLLWKAPPADGRQPFFASLSEIARARFSPELAGLMVPVAEELAPALAGMSLAPSRYLDPGHWALLAEARSQASRRRRLEEKLSALFHENKPEQAGRLDSLPAAGQGAGALKR